MELNVKKVMSFLALLLLAANTGATTLSFGCITDNDPSGSSCAIAESQMRLDIGATDAEHVLFTFSNTGVIDSFIADVYFMYQGLDFLVFDSILNPDSGVSFSEGARPSHLPGYGSAAASFSAGADSGGRYGHRKKSSRFSNYFDKSDSDNRHRRGEREKNHYGKGGRRGAFSGYSGHDDFDDDYSKLRGRNQNGINSGESLDILFDLEDASYDDVLAALLGGDLVIGIHAQGLGEGNEFSESLITVPQPAVVPVPAAVWLFGSGLLVMLGLLRRSS